MSIDFKLQDDRCTVPAFLRAYEGVNDVALVRYLKKHRAFYRVHEGISGHYYLLDDIFYVLELEHVRPRLKGAPLSPEEYADLLERCTIRDYLKTYKGISYQRLNEILKHAQAEKSDADGRYDYIKIPGKQDKLYRETDVFDVLEMNGIDVRTRRFEKKYILRKGSNVNAENASCLKTSSPYRACLPPL
jgi:hypothetical protein